MTVSSEIFNRLKTRFPSQIIGGGNKSRFHLFHAANSVCSQKVRATLIATGTPFHSHVIDIVAGENYDPAYVRTRAEECDAQGLPFASTHTGSSSVTDFGCDACVVPTVIVSDTREVMIDSLVTCRELALRLMPSLYPAGLEDAVERELGIVDRLPNFGLLAPKLAARTRRAGGTDFYNAKLEHCSRGIADNGGDPLLVAAYTAKRKKEKIAIDRLLTSEEITAAQATMADALAALALRLPEGGGLLFSDDLTLADIFWAIELIRAEDVGQSAWIHGNPRLGTYYDNLLARPAIREAIVAWPGARFDFS